MQETIYLKNENETIDLAKNLTKVLTRNTVIALNGNLGAGKTLFAKGIAKGLNIKQEVTSPTFNILKCYFDGVLPFYHIDAYRLEDSLNLDIGLEEVIDGNGICVIEWPNFIKDLLYSFINVDIEIVSPTERIFVFSSEDMKYKSVFDFLRGYKNEL